jgi:hypothetical protein
MFTLRCGTDLTLKYRSVANATRFGFDYLVSILAYEINEPRNWFVEQDGLVLNAHDFYNLYLSGEKDFEILQRFADFGLDKDA